MAKNLKVSKEKAVALFVAMGYPTATKWNEAKLMERLAALPKVIENLDVELKPKKKSLLKKILKTIKRGGEVVINKSASDESDEKETPKAKKHDKGDGNNKAKKHKKEKSEPAGKDGFGSREGTSRAKINKALSTKSKTIAELKKEAGIKGSNTFAEHLQNLIEAKYVKKTSDGYELTEKGKAKRGK